MTLEDLAFASVARSPVRVVLVDKIQANERIGFHGVAATSVVEKININILALDLGTHTGWAVRNRDGKILCGTESFSPRSSWSDGQKWQRYRSWLCEIISGKQIHHVVYERVERHEFKKKPLWASAHAYGAFEAITHMVCDSFNIRADGVNLATVKKQWTGSGRAKKDDMIAEARRRGFRVAVDEDNTADALAILDWGIKREVNGKIAPVVRKPKPRKKKPVLKTGTLL